MNSARSVRLVLCLALAFGLPLAGCQQSVVKKDTATAPAASTGFMGSRAPDIKVATEKAFAGVRKVVVAAFKVAFVEKKKLKAQARGSFLGGGTFGGRSSARVSLNGPDESTRQEIVDRAYADFVAALRARGYEVVDRGDLLAFEKYAATKKLAWPYATDASPYVLGAELSYYSPSGFEGVRLFLADGLGLAGGIGWSAPSMGAALYAEQTGTRVLSVNLVLDFANADSYESRTTSGLQVGQGLAVVSGSGLELIGGQSGTFSTNNGTIALGQPCFSPETFGEVVDVTPERNAGVELAANAVSALLGGGTNISREFEVRADPARFATMAAQVLNEADGALLDAMGSLR